MHACNRICLWIPTLRSNDLCLYLWCWGAETGTNGWFQDDFNIVLISWMTTVRSEVYSSVSEYVCCFWHYVCCGFQFYSTMSKFIFIKVCHALRPLMWSTFKASCTTTKSLFAICYVSVCYFLLTRGLMHFWSFFVTAFYFARPV